MIKRTVCISNPARLYLEYRQCKIEVSKTETHSVPIEDLAVLILENPQITITQGLLAALAEGDVLVVTCDATHKPVSLAYPLSSHSRSSLHIYSQIEASLPIRKRVWQKIIQAKIRHQGLLLEYLGIPNAKGVLNLSETVRSGDVENVEWVAAKKYWTLLFRTDFRRDRGAPGVNVLLNYGYGILRAAVARAVVGAGLHPALGIHHSNQFNSFNLVDDLIEPFRPIVDYSVCQILSNGYEDGDLRTEEKLQLLGVLWSEVSYEWQSLPIITALAYWTAAYRRTIAEDADFSIPSVNFWKLYPKRQEE